MKKTFTHLAILMALHVSAQKVTVDNIPDTVSKAFKTKFSIAEKTKWFVDDDNYQVDFKVSKADFSATFDRTGKWLQTEKFIKSSELPKAVREVVTKEFGQLSSFTYESSEKVETEKVVSYEMDIKKGELTYKMAVSEKGEIIDKQEKAD